MTGRGTFASADSTARAGARQIPGAPFRQFTHTPQGIIPISSS
jgi:hypothetical protein